MAANMAAHHVRRASSMTHVPCSLVGIRPLALSLLLARLPFAAAAQNTSSPPPDPTADPVMLTAGFLSGHPDLRFRLLGLEEYKKQNFEDALKFFQRAAYYADKPSQGMVAEMLWNGQGALQDKAQAYAWMDLAAERGYAGFLGLRERYWSDLSEAERDRALAEGQAIYAKYGDAAAQPRIAGVLRRERRQMTGSRTGSPKENHQNRQPERKIRHHRHPNARIDDQQPPSHPCRSSRRCQRDF